MDFNDILYYKNDGVATIKLNRANKLNALAIRTWYEINLALDDFEFDGNARVLVLTGEGRAFSAGDDISEFRALSESVSSATACIQRVLGTMVRIEKIAKPVIAAVNGLAMGGGCEIALAADIILASENAKFGLPEGRIGSMPPFAALRLPKIVGTKKALELLLTCEPIDAQEALRIGLVNRVVPADRLESEAIAIADKIALHAPLAAKYVKRMVGTGGDSLDEASAIALVLLGSADLKEGCDAFMTRRKPVFTGN